MIILLSGWKRSGKDTAAEFLMKNHQFNRLGFADKLKDMVAEGYGIPRFWCDSPDFKEKAIPGMPVKGMDEFARHVQLFMFGEFRTTGGLKARTVEYNQDGNLLDSESRETLYWTPRALCIFKGSGNRAVDSAYWVSRALLSAKLTSKDYVIADTRYENEIAQIKKVLQDNERLKDVKLVTVRVNRFESVDSTDPSERDLDNYPFDFYLDNRLDKITLEQFQEQINLLIGNVKVNPSLWC